MINPAAVSALIAGFLLSASNEVVNIVFGRWMEGTFGLRIIALGITAAIIGIAELGGEGLTALLVDRLGKRRSVVARGSSGQASVSGDRFCNVWG